MAFGGAGGHLLRFLHMDIIQSSKPRHRIFGHVSHYNRPFLGVFQPRQQMPIFDFLILNSLQNHQDQHIYSVVFLVDRHYPREFLDFGAKLTD